MSQLPAGWRKTTLGKVGKIITGKTPSTQKNDFWGGEIPFITPTDINNDSRYCVPDRNITKKAVNQLKSLMLPKDSICYTSIASIGLLCLTKEESLTNQQINSIIVNNDNYYLFYYYYLIYITPFLKKIAGGTTTNIINKTQFENFPIFCPPLPEQQAIAAVLSSFDDKIELLRAENQTLEQMGQELFKERFGKWKVGDDLPEGWRVGKLGEKISLQGGFVHNINLAGGEKTKIAKMGVVDGKVFFNRNSVIGYPDIIPEKYKLEEGDLIICTRDVTQDRLVIGNVALVPDDLAKFGLYAGSNTWIVKTSFHKLFLFLLFRSRNFRNHIIQSAKGSTIVMITQDAFLYTNIIIPDQETLNQFDLVIKPLFYKIRENSEQIQTLSATRDQLLPKLMSGEVRVEF